MWFCVIEVLKEWSDFHSYNCIVSTNRTWPCAYTKGTNGKKILIDRAHEFSMNYECASTKSLSESILAKRKALHRIPEFQMTIDRETPSHNCLNTSVSLSVHLSLSVFRNFALSSRHSPVLPPIQPSRRKNNLSLFSTRNSTIAIFKFILSSRKCFFPLFFFPHFFSFHKIPWWLFLFWFACSSC